MPIHRCLNPTNSSRHNRFFVRISPVAWLAAARGAGCGWRRHDDGFCVCDHSATQQRSISRKRDQLAAAVQVPHFQPGVPRGGNRPLPVRRHRPRSDHCNRRRNRPRDEKNTLQVLEPSTKQSYRQMAPLPPGLLLPIDTLSRHHFTMT
jgi:hypothetical protein